MTARRKGSVLVVLTAGFGVLMAVCALVADLARLAERRAHLQAAADASALACAFELPATGNQTGTQLQSTAKEWAERNQVESDWVNATRETRANGQPAVLVSITEPIPMLFAGFFGPESQMLNVQSRSGLNSVGEVPSGLLPFGLPAYEESNGVWWALNSTDPDRYVPLDATAAPQLIFKTSAQGNRGGNFMALALDGPGAQNYQQTIIGGSRNALDLGSLVETETGNMVGPTRSAIQMRMAGGPEACEVLVPLVSRTEWENNRGRSTVTVVGFIAATLTQVTNQGEVYARYHTRVLAQQPRTGGHASPGVFTPVLLGPES